MDIYSEESMGDYSYPLSFRDHEFFDEFQNKLREFLPLLDKMFPTAIYFKVLLDTGLEAELFDSKRLEDIYSSIAMNEKKFRQKCAEKSAKNN